jgi:signal peptidase I
MKGLITALVGMVVANVTWAIEYQEVKLSPVVKASIAEVQAAYNGKLTPLAIAATDSMRPLIDEDTIVMVEKCPYDQLKVGDIITIQNYEQVMLHRIVKIKRAGITTRGDALAFDDPIKTKLETYRGERAVAVINLRTGKVVKVR